MNPAARIADWLERHWVAPAYGGWLLGSLALFFFGAATNTLSGWLYVMSGVIFALLLFAAILPIQTVRQLKVTRRSIAPVSAGDALLLEVQVENLALQAKTLVQIQDNLPVRLGDPVKAAIELIPARSSYRWTYSQPTARRGIYRWQNVELRTGNPFGLFWCRRTQTVPARAIVYPLVLPLDHCPLIDEIGREDDPRFFSSMRSQNATEGLTRALRPYRWGDPTRLIHWRTSARYGELRVRELELFTGGQEFVIALDSAANWEAENFEQAVITAASLYFYSLRQQQTVRVWTAGTGLLQGDRQVLEALAGTQAGEAAVSHELPNLALVWLTQNPVSRQALPPGSRWILWSATSPTSTETAELVSSRGFVITTAQPLESQLQQPPS